MILFKGDFVRMTNESQWLQIKEIHINGFNPENNTMTLSDGYVCPAPVEKYIDEVRSENEQYEAIADEVRASDAVHHAEAAQY